MELPTAEIVPCALAVNGKYLVLWNGSRSHFAVNVVFRTRNVTTVSYRGRVWGSANVNVYCHRPKEDKQVTFCCTALLDF